MDEIFIPIAFFAAVVLSLYFYFRARNKERLALIEKGSDLDISKMKWGANNRYWPLKTGSYCCRHLVNRTYPLTLFNRPYYLFFKLSDTSSF